jgi:glycosyltransferase involved in cell wall biosynthesis
MKRRDVALVVAGPVYDEDARRCLVAAGDADSRIHSLLGRIPEDRVAELFDAADAAVLARSEVWTSGSLILALSQGVPVVAARLSPYTELLGEGRSGWLFEPGNPASLRNALEEAASDPELAKEMRVAALARAHNLPTWNRVAERTAALMNARTGLCRS